MFTGIITDVGTIADKRPQGEGVRFRIQSHYDLETIDMGASIACGGPCLTVVDKGAGGEGAWFEVDVSPETLDKTKAGGWDIGSKINLERSLRMGDELGGHMVTGHIDGVAEVTDRAPAGDYVRFEFAMPDALSKYVATKGSVALDGTSLTVNDVSGSRFTVMLIPHTLDVTTWGETKPGDPVNLEVDLMARYAERLFNERG